MTRPVPALPHFTPTTAAPSRGRRHHPRCDHRGARRTTPGFAFVSQRGYLTSYAESYLTTHGKLAEPFEVSPEMLEDFKDDSGTQRRPRSR